jgi:uncharacterized delta-60 repeat protein
MRSPSLSRSVRIPVLLLVLVILKLGFSQGLAQSPTSLSGRTIQLTATSGTPPFASSGSARFLPSAIDSSYAIVPLSPTILASSGTYTYSKTGENTAVLSAADVVAGAVSTAVTFSTPTSGSYVQTSTSFPGSSQTGTFFLFSGRSVPSVAGLSITVTITSGQSPFAGIGAYRLSPATYGDSYRIVGLSGVSDSSGSYVYSRNSESTGLFTFNDSVAGPGMASQLSFITDLSGTVFLRGTGSGYQTGTFEITTNSASIAKNPTQMTVVVGSPASFLVEASGTPPFSYQWRKDGTNLENATNSAFSIAAATTNDAGAYSVAVSNLVGGIVSSPASLTVLVPPSVAIQPTNTTIKLGDNGGLSVGLSGTGPIAVQWQKNGFNVMGGTNSVLELLAVTSNDAGNYRAVGTNAAGSVTSLVATVTVNSTGVPELGPLTPLADNFDPNPAGSVSAIKLQQDGKIIFGGTFTMTSATGPVRTNIARISHDGLLDEGFNFGPEYGVNLIALARSGEVAVGADWKGSILNSEGLVQRDFSFPVINFDQPPLTSLAFYKDEELLVSKSLAVVPLKGLGPPYLEYSLVLIGKTASAPKHIYGTRLGPVTAIAVQPDEKILLAGGSYLFRFTNDGIEDSTFRATLNGSIASILVQPDGKILVAGWFGLIDNEIRSSIARLNPDGTLDTDFFTPFNPGANGPLRTMVLQADGKIVVGGDFTTLGSKTVNHIARLNLDGSLDSGFNPGANGRVSAIALQADGKIVVGGDFTQLGGKPRRGIGRLDNTDPATSTISYDASSFTWLRGGSSPELLSCTFEQSVDGVIWNKPVDGTRINGGWKMKSGLLLVGPIIRMRGETVSGEYVENIWESVAPVAFLALERNVPGSFTFERFGPELRGNLGTDMSVEVSTNLINWTPLPFSILDGAERLYVDPDALNFPNRFYRGRSN